MINQKIIKINELLSHELSKICQEEFAEDFGFVTIQYVNTASDLKQAKIGVSILDRSKESDFQNQLKKKAHYLRCQIGKRIKLRNIPEFYFYIDRDAEKIRRIDELFGKIEKE